MQLQFIKSNSLEYNRDFKLELEPVYNCIEVLYQTGKRNKRWIPQRKTFLIKTFWKQTFQNQSSLLLFLLSQGYTTLCLVLALTAVACPIGCSAVYGSVDPQLVLHGQVHNHVTVPGLQATYRVAYTSPVYSTTSTSSLLPYIIISI